MRFFRLREQSGGRLRSSHLSVCGLAAVVDYDKLRSLRS
ncbi:Uncharacterised protein [Gordonia terrae]|nr:Uncharacterised protein [Gordonia terrae]